MALAAGVKGGPYLWVLIQYYRHAQATAPREPGAIADWRQEFGDPDALLASYARGEDNATAERLVAMAKPLGIELQGLLAGQFDATPFYKYVTDEAATRAGAPPDAPSGGVRAFLDAHEPELIAVVDELTTADAPVWKCDISSVVPQSSVSLLGVHILNSVLASEALAKASRGWTKDADRTMRAAWALMRSIRGQPQMIGEFAGMRLATTDTEVVRHLDVDPAVWRPMLGEYDYPAAFERSVEVEAAVRLRADGASSMTARAFRADYLDGMRANLLHTRTVSLTDAPSALQDMNTLPMSEPGREVALIAGPGLDRGRQAAQGVMLDFELTDRVLEARQEKTKTGRWPDALPNVASAQVPGAEWVYATDADGVISISLNRTLPSYLQLKFEAHR